jgi:CubicO group peptidase (beta-lactamase class C family)
MHRPAESAFASIAQERVAKEFNELIQKNDGDGCGIFLVDGPGKGRFEFATGMMSSFSGTQATIDTRFEIASVMKMMVSYAILKLVSAKVISLDANAADYVNFKELGNITVKQLLTHTSGLPDLGKGGPDYTLREQLVSSLSVSSLFLHPLTSLWCGLALVWYGDIRMNKFKFESQATPLFLRRGFNRIWDPSDALELLLREYEFLTPGAYSYSDINYTILGMLLERIHKSTLHEVLKREVFDPLQVQVEV